MTAGGGYGLGKLCSPASRQGEPAAVSTVTPLLPARPAADKPTLPGNNGSAAIPEMLKAIDQSGPSDLRRMAGALLGDSRRRRDLGMWGPLLARWSEVDGAGMLAFVKGVSPVADREWLENKAWFAWGAADPAAASVAGGTLPLSSLRELIRGMGRKDAKAAIDFTLRMPNAQMNVWLLSDSLKSLPQETVDALLPRAIYEGMRMPLKSAKTAALVETDPAAALAAAGPQLGHDTAPQVMSAIAEKDPGKAAELLAAMPSSRSRALSSLSLARVWAGQDSAAALTWARRDLQGPVRQAALLEIAAVSGGVSPLEALALVEEAGWTTEGNFGAVRGGNMIAGEAVSFPSPIQTAAALLHQLDSLDPNAARQYLMNQVPEEHQARLAKKAGIPLEP